jgi:hypothetical protein
MIALVTVAVFIYRKPFSHLFSAVGYGTLGSTERAEYSLREASHTFRRSTLDAATAAVPGMASYRAARWSRRNSGQAAAVAAGAAAGVAAGSTVAGSTAAGRAATAEAAGTAPGAAGAGTGDSYASRLRPDAPPPADGDGEASGGSRRVVGGVSGSGSARARNVTEADDASGRVAPPLDLPPRRGSANGSNGSAAAPASGWSRGAGRSAGTVSAGTVSAGTVSGGTVSTGTGPRPRVASAPPAPSSTPPVRSQGRSGGTAPPVSRPAPRPSSSGGSRGSGSGGSGGSGGSAGGGPAWPASGWPSAGPRQRSGGRARPNPAPAPPAEPADQGGGRRSNGQEEPPATPFWLRPIRRDK